VHINVLSGKEEVAAFEEKQFFRMHQSTVAKVYFFRGVLSKLIRGKLKTKVSLWRYRINELTERPFVKLVGLVAIAVTLWQGAEELGRLLLAPTDEQTMSTPESAQASQASSPRVAPRKRS